MSLPKRKINSVEDFLSRYPGVKRVMIDGTERRIQRPKDKQVGQILEGAKGGFSRLDWSQDGKQLAGGGQDGELIIWSESKRGKGFG